jgi:succinate-semialdehyde dehydrogenase/glutarate-semialdehyde dehydrogenase
MITRKVAPALAAGCSVIVKPSELTPLTALALATLAERAGVPAGVLQVITGGPEEIGLELTSNPKVRKLSFTGSTRVGRLLAKQCSSTVKRLSLELGGQAPFIVFEDADIDAAVAGAVASKYRNSGQTCVCSNRFFVHSSVYDQFARKLVEQTSMLKVGPGSDEASDIGPLINSQAVDKVEQHISDALSLGAILLTGGKKHLLGGNFFEPTVIGNVSSSMKVAKEETFGPVCPLLPFENETQVVEMANSTEYGLAAYIYSRDVNRVWRVAEAMEFGMVGVNTGAFSTEVAPFGGIKQSGFGREGSQVGIEEYLDMKYVCMGIQ